jgi:hypothetical protein
VAPAATAKRPLFQTVAPVHLPVLSIWTTAVQVIGLAPAAAR